MENLQLLEGLPFTTTVKAKPEVIFAELGAEISLLNTQTGIYYTLNAIGAEFWRQIQQAKSLAEIKKGFLEDYDVDEARCERDLMQIVANLRSNGLVEVSSVS